MGTARSVALCNGRDCRSTSGHADLARSLRAVADVATVGCLGICHSPVVAVLDPDGGHTVFERVRKPKQRRDLAAYVARGRAPSKRLTKRAVTGRARRKVIARLARRLRR